MEEGGEIMNEMSPGETAFLTRDVRERLSLYASGVLPPAPALYPKQGAALFVDISGFTALGDRLRQKHEPKEAAERLARQITYILSELTRTCLASGGDVAKFAGDALLCIFTGDEEESLIRAQNCAVDMLMGMRRYNNAAVNGGLQIHGGIARGSILHFHLGSSDDELRWYLVAGDAVAGAVALVDRAQPGQILLSPSKNKTALLALKTQGLGATLRVESRGFAKTEKVVEPLVGKADAAGTAVGILHLIEEDVAVSPSSPMPMEMRPTSPTNGNTAGNRGSKRFNATSVARESYVSDASDSSNISFGSKTDLLAEDGEVVELFLLSADTEKVAVAAPTSNGAVLPHPADPNSIYNTKLHISGSAYIPKALRAALRTGFNANEMRNRVAVVFVGVQELALSSSELATHVLSGQKLDDLNYAFVTMTRVSHIFDGEIRDLLFDDKGCVFIAVFGAHGSSEFSELKATKCAMAISSEFPSAKVGVSVGMSFVGMCGNSKRHDFVVMGHDVNFAARCMVVAQEGEVLVSAGIEKETRGFITYEKVPIRLNKKEDHEASSLDLLANAGPNDHAFKASSEIARRPSFLALYRYGMRDKDLFVGRTAELALVENTVNELCFGTQHKQPSTTIIPDGKNSNLEFDDASAKTRAANEAGRGAGIIILEAPAGMGKSAFVSRVKKLGKGRIQVASSAAFALEQDKEFFVLGHLIEAFCGFRHDMTRAQIKSLCEKNVGHEDDVISMDVLTEVCPWMALNGVAPPRAGDSVDSVKHEHSAVSRAKQTHTRGAASNSSSSSLSGVMLESPKEIERLGKELIKILQGFRGELSMNQFFAGESENGALLIVEDFQLADTVSLQCLKYLLENMNQIKGLAVFLTTRVEQEQSKPQSPSGSAGQAVLAARLARYRLVQEIIQIAKTGPEHALTLQLHGLPRTESDRLVARLLDVKDEVHGVSEGVLKFVYDKTDGFPIFLILLIEWIRDHQLLAVKKDGVMDWTEPNVINTANFPNSLADTMIARFDRLDVQTRNLLKIATCMGDEFDTITLSTLANIDLGKNNAISETQVMDSLQRALDLGVLTVKRNKHIKVTAHKWRFKHDTMHQAVHSLIPTERVNHLKELLTPMTQEVEKKKLGPLFSGFLGEVAADDDDDDEFTPPPTPKGKKR